MSWFNNHHVAHLLAAYVEGQLSAQRAAQVQQHVATCATCRRRLAAHERLAADLRLMVGQRPTPHPRQIEDWWQAISARPPLPVRRYALSMLIPALLSLLLLALPVMVEANVSEALSHTAQGTAVLPTVDGALAPPSVAFQADTLASAAQITTATAVATEPVAELPLPAAVLLPTPAAP